MTCRLTVIVNIMNMDFPDSFILEEVVNCTLELVHLVKMNFFSEHLFLYLEKARNNSLVLTHCQADYAVQGIINTVQTAFSQFSSYLTRSQL